MSEEVGAVANYRPPLIRDGTRFVILVHGPQGVKKSNAVNI